MADARRRRLLGAAFAAWLLGGCGFELRGSAAIPEDRQPLFVAGWGSTTTGRLLLERLEGTQVQLTGDPAQAGLRVRISNEGRSSRVAAVDRDGKVLAYDLGYQVTFAARGRDGRELVSPQRISLMRTLDNPDIEVLGKQAETELTFEEMEREAAEILLARLRAALL